MDISTIALAKTPDKNEVVLTLELFPPDVVYYESANWSSVITGFSHQMNLDSVSFDSSSNRLRLSLTYDESLQDESVSLSSDFSLASSKFSLPTLSLSLPQKTSNNQALYKYDDSSYTLASIIDYLSLAVAALSLLLFLAGYFGSKLQSL